jgi:hypothetical protein
MKKVILDRLLLLNQITKEEYRYLMNIDVKVGDYSPNNNCNYFTYKNFGC